MDVFVRLWIPEDSDIAAIESVLQRHMMEHDVAPPFTDELQNEIFSVFGRDGNNIFCRFRIIFPRGPVVFAEQIPAVRMAPPPQLLVPYRASMVRDVEPHLRMDPDNPFLHPTPRLVVPLQPRGLLVVHRTQRRIRDPPVLTPHACTKEDTCPICLETTKLGEEVCTLKCTHTFHNQCISRWVMRKSTCPYCRQEL